MRMNQSNIMQTLRQVCEAFRIPGQLVGYKLITRGNINATYRVDFRNPDGTPKSYMAQRVNAYVFKDPEKIMLNIDAVTSHILEKAEEGIRLHYHHTQERKNFHVLPDGSFWRLMNFIDSVVFDACHDMQVLEGVGSAFGRFQAALADFDANKLYDTILDFHNTPKRMERFFADVEKDPVGRVKEVPEEIAFLKSMRERCSILQEELNAGRLPLRATHNDTKANNVLFDKKTLMPLTVIDLDTVMPGLSVYDFGDGVRFAANTAEEDEPDTSKVALDLEKYTAFANGFIGATAGNLTAAEIGYMALGALTITVELGLRFLDDYITGDPYFKTRYPEHNLVRARCQLTLAKDMVEKYDEMDSIVRAIAEKNGMNLGKE